MAQPIDIEIRVTGASEAKQALDETSSSASGLGESGANVAVVWNNAIELFGRIVGAAGEAARAISEFADRAETLAAANNSLSTSIAEAVRRTGGMITNFELMTAANASAARGMQLTERELANLAVASERMKDLGLDVSIDSLAAAVQRGGERLSQMGIEATTSEEALAELEEKFGDLEEGADSSVGAIARFETRLANAKDLLTQTIGESNALAQSLDRLEEALQLDDGGAIRVIGDGLSVFFATVADQVTHVANAIRAFMDGDFARAAEEALQVGATGIAADLSRNVEAQGQGTQGTRGLPAAATGEPRGRTRRGGGGGRAREDDGVDDLVSGLTESAGGSADELIGGALAADRARGGPAATGPSKDALRESERLLQRNAEAAKELAERMGEVTQNTEEWSAATILAQEGFDTISNAVSESLVQLMEGGEVAFGKILENLGKEQIASGTAKLFEGLFQLITLNPAGAGMVGIGAAQIAFGLGLGAAGSAATPSASAGAAPPSRPESSAPKSGGSRAEGGTIVINYNTPVPQEQIGRQQDAARRAAERRFGRIAA